MNAIIETIQKINIVALFLFLMFFSLAWVSAAAPAQFTPDSLNAELRDIYKDINNVLTSKKFDDWRVLLTKQVPTAELKQIDKNPRMLKSNEAILLWTINRVEYVNNEINRERQTFMAESQGLLILPSLYEFLDSAVFNAKMFDAVKAFQTDKDWNDRESQKLIQKFREQMPAPVSE